MINRHEIEKIAYELYQRDGCIAGFELDHWIEAESIFQSRQAAFAETKPSSLKKADSKVLGKKKVAAKGSKPVVESTASRTSQVKVKSKRSETSKKEVAL